MVMSSTSICPAKSVTMGAMAAIKLPTGHNNLQNAGERLDEHLQPGSGAFDGEAGIVIARLTTSFSSFASLQYRYRGTNGFEYQY